MLYVGPVVELPLIPRTHHTYQTNQPCCVILYNGTVICRKRCLKINFAALQVSIIPHRQLSLLTSFSICFLLVHQHLA